VNAKLASATHLAEGAPSLVTGRTGRSLLPDGARKKRRVNSSTLQARKGEPVSPIGDGTEMQKLLSRRVSGCFLVRPAEIAAMIRRRVSGARASQLRKLCLAGRPGHTEMSRRVTPPSDVTNCGLLFETNAARRRRPSLIREWLQLPEWFSGASYSNEVFETLQSGSGA
jgi:hypothetical protein